MASSFFFETSLTDIQHSLAWPISIPSTGA